MTCVDTFVRKISFDVLPQCIQMYKFVLQAMKVLLGETLPKIMEIAETVAGRKYDDPSCPIDIGDVVAFTTIQMFETKAFGMDLGDVYKSWPQLRKHSNKVRDNKLIKEYYAKK